MAKVVTIIMAGGQGSRLCPLTKERSKPAVPIAGRFRLIEGTADAVRQNLKFVEKMGNLVLILSGFRNLES